VVDDGSTDDAIERSKTFGDPRLRIFKRQHQGAPSTSDSWITTICGRRGTSIGIFAPMTMAIENTAAAVDTGRALAALICIIDLFGRRPLSNLTVPFNTGMNVAVACHATGHEISAPENIPDRRLPLRPVARDVGRWQLSMDGTSRVTGDFQARLCERLGVKFAEAARRRSAMVVPPATPTFSCSGFGMESGDQKTVNGRVPDSETIVRSLLHTCSISRSACLTKESDGPTGAKSRVRGHLLVACQDVRFN
jgi:hypothetical protein